MALRYQIANDILAPLATDTPTPSRKAELETAFEGLRRSAAKPSETTLVRLLTVEVLFFLLTENVTVSVSKDSGATYSLPVIV